ncbi:SH3 domain-containing protein [Candidatus Nomurabacteria bacterium]|nr:SH3 domain-containing protein [Candidatus Kaiserbacteria bacterium]MCB9814236.1 SH3 domain-containing protein [Candidatus Nomurabacteria bacterium]
MKALIKNNYLATGSVLTMLALLICLNPGVAKADNGDAYSSVANMMLGSVQPAQQSPRSPLIASWVKLTDNLNVRTGPGIFNPVRQVVPKDKVAIIIDDPQVSGGILWYKVRFAGGPQGWIASNYTQLLTSPSAPVGTQVVTNFSNVSLPSVTKIAIEIDLPNSKSLVTLFTNTNGSFSKSYNSTTTTEVLNLLATDFGVSISAFAMITQTVTVIPDVIDEIHLFAKRNGTTGMNTPIWGWAVVINNLSGKEDVYSSGSQLEVDIVAQQFGNDWEAYYVWLHPYITALKGNAVDDYFNNNTNLYARDAFAELVAKAINMDPNDAKDIINYDIDNQVAKNTSYLP